MTQKNINVWNCSVNKEFPTSVSLISRARNENSLNFEGSTVARYLGFCARLAAKSYRTFVKHGDAETRRCRFEYIRTLLSIDEEGWTRSMTDTSQFAVSEFIKVSLRVNSFPTTFLIAPDGKIISIGLNRARRTDLRGRDLLTTLDELLPVI
jgi:hypothetical protein